MNTHASTVWSLVLFCSVLMLLTPVAVCSDADPDILATVGGTPITRADVDFELMEGHGTGTTTPKMRQEALENIVRYELLAKEGERLKLDLDEEQVKVIRDLELRLKQYKRTHMARRVYRSEISPKVK